MKVCPKCNLEYEDEFDFCSKCGYRLKDKEKCCQFCGKVIKTDGEFCPYCGKFLQSNIKKNYVKMQPLNRSSVEIVYSHKPINKTVLFKIIFVLICVVLVFWYAFSFERDRYLNLSSYNSDYTGVVNSWDVNMYSDESGTSSVKTKLQKGEVVQIMDINNGWIKVKNNNGQIGYIMSHNLKY